MKKFIFLVFICGAILFGSEAVHAQAGTFDLSSTSINKGYELTESSIPYIDPDGDGRTNLSDYLAGLFRLMIGVAAIGSIVVIIIGGFEYIASATPFGKSEGKKRIQNAFWGLGLVLFSYLIINTINPAILQFNPDTIIPVLVVEKDIFLSNQDQYERRLLALGVKSKEIYDSLVPYAQIDQWEKEMKEAEKQSNPQLAAELKKRISDAMASNIKLSTPQIIENYVVRYNTANQNSSFTTAEVDFQRRKLLDLLQQDINDLKTKYNKPEDAALIEKQQQYADQSMTHVIKMIELRDKRMTNIERVKQAELIGNALAKKVTDPTLQKKFQVEAAARAKLFLPNNN